MTTDTDKLVESFADAFYEQLKHGDAAHQQWLRKETDKFFAAHAPAFRDRIIASLCGDVEPVAWGIFANNGNIRFWACDKASADSQAAKTGGDVEGIFRASTVAALKARVAELEKDAARYRWLRDEGNPYAILVVGNQEKTGIKPFYGIELDAAIDAALTKGQP